MRQKCVRNASKWVLFYWEKRKFQNASEMCQNCVWNASKTRRTPLGENTFWTIPKRGIMRFLNSHACTGATVPGTSSCAAASEICQFSANFLLVALLIFGYHWGQNYYIPFCFFVLGDYFLRVPNGVFQTVFFRFLASACDRAKPFQSDTNMPQSTSVFKQFGAFCPCASSPPSEHTTLKNTV